MNESLDELFIGLDFGEGVRSVGSLFDYQGRILFEYDSEFLKSGLEISPIHLPLSWQPDGYKNVRFEGLAGVFEDSLPDGWGRLLSESLRSKNDIKSSGNSILERLAQEGMRAMGALVYQPNSNCNACFENFDLNLIAKESAKVLQGYATELLAELKVLNGSLAGARPKIQIGVDSNFKTIALNARELPADMKAWIVKFTNAQDTIDAGAIEFVYAKMALAAGLNMPTVHLFESAKGPGYFGVERFDRREGKRVHMHSVSGLTHTNFRYPSLDYEQLLRLTAELTKDIREVRKMYRLAVFNVLAYNRDDHGKNFSFLMDENGKWMLSPPYDITFSSGPGGEQSTTVVGEGKKPTRKHLEALAIGAGLEPEFYKNVISQTLEALSQWDTLAKDFGVSNEKRILIQKTLSSK